MPPGMIQPVFRFAPSPNGYLHLGHALSALIDYEMARVLGGRFLLRIEDIDTTRCRPEYEAAIHEDLAWLGIAWEEPVRRQSEHLDDYRRALSRLRDTDLIYPAFESRADIARMVAERERHAPWPRDPDGTPLYPGKRPSKAEAEAASRKPDEPYVYRLDMNAATGRTGALTWVEVGANPKEDHETLMAHPEQWGDVVLARKDTPTSYHLSVVVDDAAQGVTHVVRGQDLQQATAVHRVLQSLLGLPAPLYHHHRLVLGEDGRKLSKSTQATALRELRAGGAMPADIRRMAGLAESA
jgi:glutamyl-Q tRNA(Asp) synthetase